MAHRGFDPIQVRHTMRMRADRYIPPGAFCHRAGWESLPWREDRSESRSLRHERATVRNAAALWITGLVIHPQVTGLRHYLCTGVRAHTRR